MSELNQRQQQFATYYLQGYSGAEAARKAGYSEKRGHQTAYDLLQNEAIQAEIRRLEVIQDNELRQEFRRTARKAKDALEKILDDPNANHQAKVAAAKEMINRGYSDAANLQQEVTADDTREAIEAKFSSTLFEATTTRPATIRNEEAVNERTEILDATSRVST